MTLFLPQEKKNPPPGKNPTRLYCGVTACVLASGPHCLLGSHLSSEFLPDVHRPLCCLIRVLLGAGDLFVRVRHVESELEPLSRCFCV